MITNFSLITPFLKFESEREFYFIQVIQRKKEHPSLGKNNRLIKAYYINSLEKLQKYKPEMITLAMTFNARIYIHLARRDAKKIALEMLEDLAHCINSEQYELSKIYTTACGRHHSKKDKLWLVDIDHNDSDKIQKVVNTIESLQPLGETKVKLQVPTKNGIHLITSPFNSAEFKKIHPDIEVHKNNPTILFVP